MAAQALGQQLPIFTKLNARRNALNNTMRGPRGRA